MCCREVEQREGAKWHVWWSEADPRRVSDPAAEEQARDGLAQDTRRSRQARRQNAECSPLPPPSRRRRRVDCEVTALGE
eukprot:2971624-Prymnesium_polylepis.1